MAVINCEDCAFWHQKTTNSGFCMQAPPNDINGSIQYPQTQPRILNERDPRGEQEFEMGNTAHTPSPGGCGSGEPRA